VYAIPINARSRKALINERLEMSVPFFLPNHKRAFMELNQVANSVNNLQDLLFKEKCYGKK